MESCGVATSSGKLGFLWSWDVKSSPPCLAVALSLCLGLLASERAETGNDTVGRDWWTEKKRVLIKHPAPGLETLRRQQTGLHHGLSSFTAAIRNNSLNQFFATLYTDSIGTHLLCNSFNTLQGWLFSRLVQIQSVLGNASDWLAVGNRIYKPSHPYRHGHAPAPGLPASQDSYEWNLFVGYHVMLQCQRSTPLERGCWDSGQWAARTGRVERAARTGFWFFLLFLRGTWDHVTSLFLSAAFL